MQKKALTILPLLMLAVAANGFQSSVEWVKYTSVEGRYNVMLPQQPKLSTQQASASSGEKMTQHLAQASDSDGLFSLAYFEYGTGMTFSLDNARDGMVGSVKGMLLSDEGISLGGYSGRELKVASKLQNIDILIRARIYDIGGRVYIVQHLFKKADDSARMVKKTARFFDSFKVTLNK